MNDDLIARAEAAATSANAQAAHGYEPLLGELGELVPALVARVRELEEALRFIRGLPSEHDLLHNAVARAVWTRARAALREDESK